ncbi:MAG: hypothetical protein HOP11_07850 [Saprospiraceae bacterium]|nr:hypothetical protein [Saprospiraceae bacterium]
MEFKLEVTLNVPPDQVYKAWLSSKGHSSMTGGKAEINDKPGSAFTAWDGYITGENMDLDKNKRILQTWRTNDFKKNQEDSLVDIELIPIANNSTKLVLVHSNLEDVDIKYRQGWKDHYFAPMKKYFSRF